MFFLYWQLFYGACRLAVRWIFLLKWDFFTTKKDRSTGPTALERYGPYFESMGQWPGPTINLKACIYMYKKLWGVTAIESEDLYTGFVCLIWIFTSQSTIYQLFQNRSSWVEPGLNQYYARINVMKQGSDAGQARTLTPEGSRQALYHRALALPWI